MQVIEVDGQPRPVANIVRRGAALAVDLCIIVLCSATLLYLLSLQVPLDTDPARMPILLVVLAAGVYLVWARDHVLPSAGREIFHLELIRPGGDRLATSLARPITVSDPAAQNQEYRHALIALCVVAASSGGGMLMLSLGLKSTTVYQEVARFTARTEPYATEQGASPTLGAVPRALLVGKRRAYLQTATSWAGQEGSLEFYLSRTRSGQWQVDRVRRTEPSMHGKFALATTDEEIPTPPGPG